MRRGGGGEDKKKQQQNDLVRLLETTSSTAVSFLTQSLALETEWDVGIGGGLWTTGLLLCQYVEDHAAFFARVLKEKRVIEIGSGTGLVGLCLASSKLLNPREVVVTDRADHLGLIRRNAQANKDKLHAPLSIDEFDWLQDDGAKHLAPLPFDVVVGTDVAYCKQLYEPVAKALQQIAGPHTLIILGVTRTDTGPEFFRFLHEAGFDYCLLPTVDGNSSVEAGGFALLSVVRRQKK